MARRIRLPFIVDVVLVSDPAEIRALNEVPSIDRNFVARGPLINRLIVARIRRWFEIAGQLLPSLTPRGDLLRAERQRQLAAKLDSTGCPSHWTNEQIAGLVSYVRGKGSAEGASITIQQILGNLFDPGYRADIDTWKAAQMIDRFRDGFSLVQLLWLLTGQLARSRSLLVERANNDRWCMHGTAIGIHGIVQALARMRELRAAPTAASFGNDAVLGQCLAPPRQVPRTVEAPFATPLVGDELRRGGLLLLQLAAAGRQAPGPEPVFMHGHWNACPAGGFVSGLLLTVWRRSFQEAGDA
jgi:hypothetical protein